MAGILSGALGEFRLSSQMDTGDAKFKSESLFEIEEDEEDGYAASWNIAIQHCKSQLNDHDFKKLEEFGSYEALTEDLRTKETKKPNFQHIRQRIRILNTFLGFFLITMGPKTGQSSVVWGLLYLLIELANSQSGGNSRWTQTREMLEKVTRSLDACKRTHQGKPFDDEMKLALNDAFIALITLWAEAAGFMRSHPYESERDLQNIKTKFDKAVRDVDDTFSYLRECAAMRGDKVGQSDNLTNYTNHSYTPPSGGVMPYGGAPHYNDDDFFGREDLLEKLSLALSPDETKGRRFCTLSGLGGVGKSKLALAFANKFKRLFDVTLWVKSQTPISISQSFTEMAKDLGISDVDENGKGDLNQKLVYDYLNKNCRSWLIIWDNVESQKMIRPYIAKTITGASMLVTTRYPEEPYLRARGPIMAVGPFTELESKQFFSKLLGRDSHSSNSPRDDKAAEILLQKMNGLAIGICTMASRLRSSNLSTASFLKRYSKGTIAGFEGELADYDLTLETIWNDSFSALQTEEMKGKNEGFSLLGVLTFCSPDNIPKQLFVVPQSTVQAGLPQFCGPPEDPDYPDFSYLEAVTPLWNYGLITSETNFPTIAIHRLVQTAYRKFLCDSDEEGYQESFSLAVRLVHRAFPQQVAGRSLHLQWEACRTFIQHGTSLADVYEDSQKSDAPLEAPSILGELLCSCVWFLFEMGEYSELLRVANIALKIVEPDTFFHGHLNNSLYCTYWALNQIPKAREHLEVALRVMKNFIPETSEEYIGIVSNFGNVLASEGQSEAAVEKYLHVESVRAEFNYPKNLGQAFIHLGVGRAELQQNNMDDAETRFLAAKEVVLNEHGEKGKYMQDVFFALGNLEMARSNFSSADDYFGKAFEIQQAENTADSFNAAMLYKMACVRIKQNDLPKALSLLDEAIKIAETCDSQAEQARCLFKKSSVLRMLGGASNSKEVHDYLERANELKDRLREQSSVDGAGGETGTWSAEQQFDRLVGLFQR